MKKLAEYAKQHNITYRSAYNHFKRGLIENAYQLPSGTIVIPDSYKPQQPEHIITYARVSSSENKDNLERQSQRLQDFCAAKGWIVNECIEEVGSGINENRKKLDKILTQQRATKLIVEHKDRLTRFGFNFIEKLCKSFNCEVIVINNSDNGKEDLMQDFVSIITSFCARLYGLRRSKRKTEQLIKELAQEEPQR